MRRLLAAILLVVPLAAHAWGADGHQTVATLAAALLKGTPAEARLKALLGDMTLQQASVWADCAKGISPSHDYSYPSPGRYRECAPLESPAHIAEMADYVRRNDRRCALAGEETCHKQTHYADVALQRSRYRLGFAGTRRDDVVGSLRQAILVLQGRPASGPPYFKSRREALLVLVHLVGDVHQPLHVGAVYLDARGRRVDPDKSGQDPAMETVGGNSLFVVGPTFVHKPPARVEHQNRPDALATAGLIKLHSIWDAVPDELKPGSVDAAWLARARKVRPNTGDPLDWPARWATQTLGEARSAFAGLKFSPRQGTHWTVSLPGGYGATADAIKQRQLTAAGARLAGVLKAVLAD